MTKLWVLTFIKESCSFLTFAHAQGTPWIQRKERGMSAALAEQEPVLCDPQRLTALLKAPIVALWQVLFSKSID